jgi:hypothetical protein
VLQPGLQARLVFVEFRDRPFDHQGSTIGHRVAGVHCEVDQNLLDPAAVRADHQWLGRRYDEKLDVFYDGACQQGVCLGYRRVDVQQLWPGTLAAGEQQKLPGESGRAFGCLADLAEVGLERRIVGGLIEKAVKFEMMANRLLKSCATPPASCPRLCRRWASSVRSSISRCRASARLRAVMSRATAETPTTTPSVS